QLRRRRLGAGGHQRGRAFASRAPVGRSASGALAMETAAPAFAAWLDDFFAAYYRRRPVNATFIGVHDHDDRLPDLSEPGVGDTVAEIATLRRRLRDLPPEPLTAAEALDRRLAEAFLEIQQW